MHTRLLRHRRTILASLVLIPAIIGTIAWQAPRALADARARWQANPIAHYLLTSETGDGCILSAEVRAEQVVRLIQRDPCAHPAATVSELFRAVGYIPADQHFCTGASCTCKTDTGGRVQYDRTHGYPQRIVFWSYRSANWTRSGYWHSVELNRQLPQCDRRSEALMIRHVQIEPLP